MRGFWWFVLIGAALFVVGVTPITRSASCVGFKEPGAACPWVTLAYDWQSLIGGLLALAGAILAAIVVKAQIDAESERASATDRHRLRVAKIDAVLTLRPYFEKLVDRYQNNDLCIASNATDGIPKLADEFELEDSVEFLAELPPADSGALFDLALLSERLLAFARAEEPIDELDAAFVGRHHCAILLEAAEPLLRRLMADAGFTPRPIQDDFWTEIQAQANEARSRRPYWFA